MARSRGQIRKRGTGKYLVRVYVGRIDGKRKYKSKVVNGSKKDAEKKLTEMLRKKDRGVLAHPNSEKLDAFLDDWLDMKRGKVAPATLRNYIQSVENHIKPALGHLKLDQLSVRLVQSWINDLKNEKDLSPSTIKLIHSTLRQALNQAEIWSLIPSNPADGGKINLPSQEDREYRIFTKPEIATFLEETEGDRFHVMWALLFATGLRPQEALALKWEDLDDGWLHVRRVVKRDSAETRSYEISEQMKTKRSRRRVKLPDVVREKLERHRAEQAKHIMRSGVRYDRNGFIFADEEGSFHRPWVLSWAFKRTLEDCGLPDEIRLYDTRHTHISHLIMDGVDLKKASARAGHSSISQTADTYAHLSEEAEEEMAEVSARMFAGGGN